jgi:hypothetical protein
MRLTLLTLTLAVTGVPALRVMPLSAGRRVFSRRTPAALSTASSSSAEPLCPLMPAPTVPEATATFAMA